MKKKIKVGVGILGAIIFIFILDFICIFIIGTPILAIEAENDGYNKVYKGLIYNTYDCVEYSVPQIKIKGTKFNCSSKRIDLGNVVEIVDKTKSIKNFACAEALEEFYHDDKYTYFYSCIKSKYITVKYESGYEESVRDALNYGSISISDLDFYNIEYLKYGK